MNNGNLQDFITTLFVRYQEIMINSAMRYVHNRVDAEDIVSNCWIMLIQHGNKLQMMSAHSQHAYIMRCVANRSIDFIRKKTRHNAHMHVFLRDYPNQNGDESITDILVCRSRNNQLEQYINQLPPQERKVIEYRLANWKTSEIAEDMHISVGSVRVYASRAMDHLRCYLHSTEDVNP